MRDKRTPKDVCGEATSPRETLPLNSAPPPLRSNKFFKGKGVAVHRLSSNVYSQLLYVKKVTIHQWILNNV